MRYVAQESKEERLARRDQDIIKRYDKLASQEFKGRQLYRHEVILAKIAYEFYLSENYVGEILNGTTSHQQSAQLKFDIWY